MAYIPTDYTPLLTTIYNNLVIVRGYTAKIDDATTSGLTGAHDSLAYRAAEIERHIHGRERWAGLHAAPVGTTVAADFETMTPFQIDAGNDAWGAWLCILGSTDLPAQAGRVAFDLHRIMVVAVERASTIYRVQIGFGASGAAALAAGAYTEFAFSTPAASRQTPIEIQTRRYPAGTVGWARCWADGAATGWMDFLFGLHEYEG